MKKTGVSLIVLVITIIVMLILASAVAVSLNNANVIESAKSAVCKTNLKEVQEIANVAWVEAYGLGERDQTKLKDAVDKALAESKIDLTPYDINVTLDGVKVIGTGCADIANPDNNNGTQVAKEWSYAYTYSAASGWSSKITNVGEEPTGDIVAKLYKAGGTSIPYGIDSNRELLENETYKMIISGTGAIPTMVDLNNRRFDGWMSDMMEYLEEETDNPAEVMHVTELVIEDGITSIGDYGFMYFNSLLDLTLPTTLTSIGTYAFPSMQTIETINYDGTKQDWNNITIADGNLGLDIGFWVYAYTYSADTGWSERLTNNFQTLEGDVIVKVLKTGFKATPTLDGTSFEGLEIPEGDGYRVVISGEGTALSIITDETNVEGDAWWNGIWDYLKEKTTEPSEMFYVTRAKINEGITAIPDYCFFVFRSLEEITIANSVEKIGKASIDGTIIEKITIPDNVKVLSESCFNSCGNLKEIVLPKSLTTIEYHAFFNCNALETVYYKRTEEDWKNIVISTGNTKLTGANIVYNYSE